MRRSIADYVNKKKRDFEAHLKYDKDFHIKPTKFRTDNVEQEYEYMTYIKEYVEEGKPVYKKSTKTGLGFKRKKYLNASIDIFDVIRKLPNQAYILFKYIIKNINYDDNYIKLTTNDIKNILKTTYQPVASKAINDLIHANLICRCAYKEDRDIFCINHQEYFKGNFTNFIINHNNIYGVVDREKYKMNTDDDEVIIKDNINAEHND